MSAVNQPNLFFFLRGELQYWLPSRHILSIYAAVGSCPPLTKTVKLPPNIVKLLAFYFWMASFPELFLFKRIAPIPHLCDKFQDGVLRAGHVLLFDALGNVHSDVNVERPIF